MANQKITDLRSLNLYTIANEDLIPVVDVSEDTSPTGELKKISVNQLTISLSERVSVNIDDKINSYATSNLIPLSQKGVVNGVAPLNTLGKIDSGYLSLPTSSLRSIFGRSGEVVADVGDYSNYYLVKAGDSMSGPLNVPITPTLPSQSVSKKYVDNISASLNARIDGTTSGINDVYTYVDGKDSTTNTRITDVSASLSVTDTSLSNRINAITLSVISAIYPVGSLYSSTVSTNPASILGLGTWTAFGAGRVPVGFNAAEIEFDTVEKTGGEKNHTLSTGEMPNHAHTIDPPSTGTSGVGDHGHTIDPPSATTSDSGDHQHTFRIDSRIYGSYANLISDLPTPGFGSGTNQHDVAVSAGGNHAHTVDIGSFTSGVGGGHSHTVDIAPFASSYDGGGAAHNNLQPYIVVYMWKRTA